MDNKKAAEILRAIKIGTAHAFLNDDAITSALDTAISALEKQEQDRWIPCSVRPPENKKRVLVSYDTKDGKKVDISMFDKYGCLLGLVSAWRPLPEPYQEDEA